MSITDGQVVLLARPDGPEAPINVDPRLSVSRIGTRAYPPALETLAPQIRYACLVHRWWPSPSYYRPYVIDLG